MKKLLVIVDMVNGFVKEGALADPKINQITPNIISKINEYLENSLPIISFRDCHKTNDIEFNTFPPHCIKGTSESNLIDELKPFEDYFIDIEKDTTNGYNTDAFKNYISNNTFDIIEVTGCCTDICVETFSLSLKDFFKENNIFTEIVVIENAVFTFDSPTHNAGQMHKKSIEKMRNNGIIIK